MNTEMIWIQFSSKLFLFINSKVRNRCDSEDLLQEVFLKIHDKLDSLKDFKKVESWIFQITRNVINDYYRKNNSYESLPEEIVSLPADEQDFRKDIARCLISLTDQLPDKYKQPLKAAYMEGRTQSAVSEEIGLSLSCVKSRIQRGRNMLKGILKECCDVESSYHPIDCDCNC